MSLSPLHKHLVRRTFTQLVTHDEQATRLFRQHLGANNAAVFASFSGQTAAQADRPIKMLALIISLLDDPAALRIQLQTIRAKQRHISDDQFRLAGQVLLQVIEQQLGNSFTREIQEAWLAFYRFLGSLSSE